MINKREIQPRPLDTLETDRKEVAVPKCCSAPNIEQEILQKRGDSPQK